jgi:NAD-dependent protein deacetylase/lipoamidase
MSKQEKNLQKRIETAAKWIKNSKHLIVFTGAGISTESGIPDFRGPDGVWTRRDKGLPPPKSKVPWSQVEPNVGHMAIVDLTKMGLCKYIISQNVDNLHLKSGIPSELLAELHGNSYLMRCSKCDKQFPKKGFWDEARWGKAYHTSKFIKGQPTCPECNGRIYSSVVNFGDDLPSKEIDLSYTHSQKADVYLVVGSSLSVTPAADLVPEAKNNGAKLIIINQMETQYDNIANLRFHEGAGEVLSGIIKLLK